MNSNTSSTNNYTLGSPNLGTKRPLSGASFKWAPSEDIQPFTVYEEYLKSVTKGGEAAGPEKAKYGRRNTAKLKNKNGEYIWVSFDCKSCSSCSSEVYLLIIIIICAYLPLLTNVYMNIS